MAEFRSMQEAPVVRQLIDRWRHFWALSWLWKGLALGGAAAVLIALAAGVVLVSGGDGDSPAVLGPRAAPPTATTTPAATPTTTPTPTPSPTLTATVSPHSPATSEKTPTSPPKATPTPKPAPAPTPTPPPAGGSDATLVGAGDIASCSSSSGDEATANLLDGIAGTVFTAGDNAYESGSASEFTQCYAPS